MFTRLRQFYACKALEIDIIQSNNVLQFERIFPVLTLPIDVLTLPQIMRVKSFFSFITKIVYVMPFSNSKFFSQGQVFSKELPRLRD
jgi:hypothetical protein